MVFNSLLGTLGSTDGIRVRPEKESMSKVKSAEREEQQLHVDGDAGGNLQEVKRKMPSMRDIARTLGISVATVSRALRNDPAVQESTRVLIQREAEGLGYRRNAFVGNFMSSIRNSTASDFRGNLGLIWGKQANSTDHRLSQIKAGVVTRVEELGYSLSEFDLTIHKTQSIGRILYNRGISGVLIAVPSFSSGKAYLRFDFSKFSCVALGWGLFRPLLNTVRFDYFQAVRLALHHAHHRFGGNIAAVWDETTDLRSHRAAQASFVIHHPVGPALAHKLFLTSKTLTPAVIKRHKIECLLVTAGIRLQEWVSGVIPDSHVVRFEHPGEEPCFGWVDTQNILLGKWGVDMLTSKLSGHERGIPDACQVMLVPPKWRKGSE